VSFARLLGARSESRFSFHVSKVAKVRLNDVCKFVRFACSMVELVSEYFVSMSILFRQGLETYEVSGNTLVYLLSRLGFMIWIVTEGFDVDLCLHRLDWMASDLSDSNRD